jgi:hypothetical protein
MAQSSQRSRSKSSGSRSSRSASASKSTPSRAASSGNGRAGGSGANRKRTTTSASRKRSTSRASGSQQRTSRQSPNGSGPVSKVTGAVTGAAKKARVPVIAGGAAAAAVAGGALLKRQLTPKRRKVLGVSLPSPKIDGVLSGGFDLKPVAKQISKAGKRAATTSQQLHKLSDDVERVGKTAQKVGDSLS